MKGKYLILGTNLGDKMQNLKTAIILIEKEIGDINAISSIYETEAWGYKEQPTFLNQVIRLDSDLNPFQLLNKILRIEKEMGRKRFQKWHERLIDIDILFYDDLVINTENLVVPHPEIPNRLFTLVPLCELSKNEIHPSLNKSMLHLLKETTDPLGVKKVIDTD